MFKASFISPLIISLTNLHIGTNVWILWKYEQNILFSFVKSNNILYSTVQMYEQDILFYFVKYKKIIYSEEF